MQTLKIKVDKNNLKIINKEVLTSGTINAVECEIFFSNEWEKLTKTIIYILDDGRTFIDGIDIEKNKCIIPSEVLASKSDFAIGIYGITLIESMIKERYTTNIEYISVSEGCYMENVEESVSEKQASIWQIYLEKVEEIFTNIKTAQSDVELNKNEINSIVGNFEITASESLKEINDETSASLISINENREEAVNQIQTEKKDAVNELNNIANNKKNEIETINNKLENKMETIERIIPEQASKENQLADKDFVNSSIATNTATFQGTFNSLEELQKVTADINDYANVITIENDNTFYNRYTHDGKNWIFNFKINTTTFTAEQWKAINSGITEDLVDKLIGIDLSNYIKNTDYASSSKGGVIKIGTYGSDISAEGILRANIYSKESYPFAKDNSFIGKKTLENVIELKELVDKTYVNSVVGDIETLLDTIEEKRY